MFLLSMMRQLFNQMMDRNLVEDPKMSSHYAKKGKDNPFMLMTF
jgi:hypothetical protein